MKISGIDLEPLLYSVAAKLATMNSKEQGKFFAVFSDELGKTCATNWDAQMQCTYISQELNDKQKETFLSIGYKE